MNDPHRSNLETAFLSLLVEKRPIGVLINATSPPEEFLDVIKSMYPDPDVAQVEVPALFGGLLLTFTERGWIGVELHPSGFRRVTIRPNGLRELARRHPGSSIADLDRAVQDRFEALATFQEIAEAASAQQTALDERLAAFDAKIAQVDRNFYSQVVPLFAIFVAAFALILTGTQAGLKITATEPGQMFLQSLAIMGPIVLAIVVLVLLSWLVSRPWRRP